MAQAASYNNDFEDPEFITRLIISSTIGLSLLGYALYTVRLSDMDVPFWLRCAWEDYGPFIADYFLSSFLVRLIRRRYIQYLNDRRAAGEAGISLLDLPDELLLQICECIVPYPCVEFSYYSRCQFHATRTRALINLSTSNSRLRQLAAPILFRKTVIQHDKWRRVTRALTAMHQTLHPVGATKDFRFAIRISCTSDRQAPKPPRRLPQQVAIVLSSFTALQSLTFVVPWERSSLFQTVFSNRALTLPTVQSLVIGPHADWLIQHCPHVHTIASDQYSWRHGGPYDRTETYSLKTTHALIHSAAKAEHLLHFRLAEDHSYEPYLREIQRMMPHLRSLGTFIGERESGITNLIPLLAPFTNLRCLLLAEVRRLRVGYDPPGCGNIYLGPNGAKYRRQVSNARVVAMRKVAEMAFHRLPQLGELWIADDDRFVVQRDTFGRAVRYKWTRERLNPRELHLNHPRQGRVSLLESGTVGRV